MDQAEDVIGQYADLDLPGTQEVVEPPEARPGAVTEVFGAGVAPLAAHGDLGGLGDLDIGAGQPELQTIRTLPSTLSSASPATSRIEEEK